MTELARRLKSAYADGAGGARMKDAEEQLARTLDELRDLAAGLHPGGLVEAGLADALASLVVRSPVPVQLRVPDVPPTEEIATAAYFVCSEALANVIKYAVASRVVISITQSSDRLFVEVADDGVGGAVIGGGTGLRGLADRVEALGGRLDVDSLPGLGTRVTAELPLGGHAR